MKNLIVLAFAALSFNASASDEQAPEYYSPEFTITKVSPMCPRNIPSGAMCGGYGSIVTISANLGGCLDSLVFHEVKKIAGSRGVELHSVAVALRNPESARVRCIRANSVSKTIAVPEMGEVTIVNSIIQN